MKKIACLLFAFALIAALFCGCSAKEASNDMAEEFHYSAETSAAYAVEDSAVLYASPALGDSTDTSSLSNDRKLVRRMSLRVETEAFDDFLSQVESHITQCGGYAENTEVNADYRDLRSAAMTIRIPADRLDEFAGQISEISNVVYRTEANEDITTQYVDTESHRDALKVEQERLLELLGKAETLAEILEIESRLTDVRYELESMEKILRTYDNQVNYATVSLEISEVKVYTETEEKGFWKKLGDGFMDSLEGLGNFFVTLFSFLVIAFPYLLIFVGIPLVILFVLLGKRKRRKIQNGEKIDKND